MPETLLESELFGHIKGSFTGAINNKKGKFLIADGGTIFLDEISNASPALQVKLLRVIQERQFEPVGSNRTETVDTRIITASNKDLAEEVKRRAVQGRFVLSRERCNDRFAAAERQGRRCESAGKTFSADLLQLAFESETCDYR